MASVRVCVCARPCSIVSQTQEMTFTDKFPAQLWTPINTVLHSTPSLSPTHVFLVLPRSLSTSPVLSPPFPLYYAISWSFTTRHPYVRPASLTLTPPLFLLPLHPLPPLSVPASLSLPHSYHFPEVIIWDSRSRLMDSWIEYMKMDFIAIGGFLQSWSVFQNKTKRINETNKYLEIKTKYR